MSLPLRKGRREIFPHFLDVSSWRDCFTMCTQALGLENWDRIVLADWTLKLPYNVSCFSTELCASQFRGLSSNILEHDAFETISIVFSRIIQKPGVSKHLCSSSHVGKYVVRNPATGQSMMPITIPLISVRSRLVLQ